MHSCELITNLRAKKVLCHCVEVRISGAATTDCVFCNMIGYRQSTPGKAIKLMKPKESAEGHQYGTPNAPKISCLCRLDRSSFSRPCRDVWIEAR